MTDPGNSRQILPSTVSSAAAAGPATSNRARVSIACESCKRKKCKCTGGPPCEACRNANVRCIFDETQDKRRKVHAKRTIQDLTSTNEHLTFEVKVFRTLQRAIQNDTHKEAVEQIRRHASLLDIALTLGDSSPDIEDEEAESADTDLSLHELDSAEILSGKAVLQNRGPAHFHDTTSSLLATRPMSSDLMELEHRPLNKILDSSHVREMRDERNHYKNIVTRLQNGTAEEATEALRRLRAPREGNAFHDSQLQSKQDEQTKFGDARTLPEMSTSIRSQRASWFERDGSSNGQLLSATSPYNAQTSTTNVSTTGSQSSVSSPFQSTFAMGSTGMDLSQYITSNQRMRRESGTYTNNTPTRSK